MLVQRRIQEEIHGSKIDHQEMPLVKKSLEPSVNIPRDPTPTKPSIKLTPVETKPNNVRRSQQDEKPMSVSPNQMSQHPSSCSIDLHRTLSNHEFDVNEDDDDDDDDDQSTNEIVTRNQSKLDFHKTMTPMLVRRNDSEWKFVSFLFTLGSEKKTSNFERNYSKMVMNFQSSLVKMIFFIRRSFIF